MSAWLLFLLRYGLFVSIYYICCISFSIFGLNITFFGNNKKKVTEISAPVSSSQGLPDISQDSMNGMLIAAGGELDFSVSDQSSDIDDSNSQLSGQGQRDNIRFSTFQTLSAHDYDMFMPAMDKNKASEAGNITDEICTICQEIMILKKKVRVKDKEKEPKGKDKVKVDEVPEDDYDIRRVIVCGHYFHGKCLLGWLKVNESCPNCKEVLKRDEMIEKLNNSLDLGTDLNSTKVVVARRARPNSINLEQTTVLANERQLDFLSQSRDSRRFRNNSNAELADQIAIDDGEASEIMIVDDSDSIRELEISKDLCEDLELDEESMRVVSGENKGPTKNETLTASTKTHQKEGETDNNTDSMDMSEQDQSRLESETLSSNRNRNEDRQTITKMKETVLSSQQLINRDIDKEKEASPSSSLNSSYLE